MSLAGIRDISVLDTPPKERLPVQTYVIEYGDGLLADAVSRELARGGQAFILYNKVESIEKFAFKVQNLVPSARIITAHGKMNEENLERSIETFYGGRADVLICTTIIENGIDIPNCNTLLVYESDKLGLSQLYQLRGRVGRGNRLAYVYFTYIPEKTLSEDAEKRLKAIMEFTEFGSGFKIAMRDLEIRGAGNVLGRQQHGQMENVGYDMYVRLLKSSISEVTGEPDAGRRVDTEIIADAYIPEKYVEDNDERLRIYQRIAGIDEAGEDEAVLSELRDIYGKPPECVVNLVAASHLKVLAKAIGAEKAVIKRDGSFLELRGIEILKNKKVTDAVDSFKDICILSVSQKPLIIFRSKRMNSNQILGAMSDFCREVLGRRS